MLGAYLLGIALGSAAARALCRDGDENVRAVPLQAVSYLFAASALAFSRPAGHRRVSSPSSRHGRSRCRSSSRPPVCSAPFSRW